MSFQAEIDKAIKEKKLYFIGDALPVDWYAGFKLWLAHAEAGDAKAQYNVGRCYSRGDGTDIDREKALYWYIKAAEQGDPRVNFNLSIYFGDKKEPTFNFEKSEAYLKKAVELKESRALALMDERANYAYFKKGEKLKEEIQNLLLNKRLDDAKKLASEALEKNYPWASSLFCALSIEIAKICVTTILDRTSSPAGSVNGDTQYSYKLTKEYTTEFTIKNNTDYECSIIFLKGDKLKYPTNDFIKIEKSAEKNYLNKTLLDPNNEDIYYIVTFLEEKNNPKYEITENLIVNGIIQYIKIPILNPPKAVNLKVNNRKGCFVVTACYGDEEHSIVRKFRKFRDNVLAKYSFGRILISFYYEYGPNAAEFIKTKEYIKKPLRKIFTLIAMILP